MHITSFCHFRISLACFSITDSFTWGSRSPLPLKELCRIVLFIFNFSCSMGSFPKSLTLLLILNLKKQETPSPMILFPHKLNYSMYLTVYLRLRSSSSQAPPYKWNQNTCLWSDFDSYRKSAFNSHYICLCDFFTFEYK